MSMGYKSIVQEISFLKHELKPLNSLDKASLEGLAIQCTVNSDLQDLAQSEVFITRLKCEVLFLIENITLQEIESLSVLLKRYLLSDGTRLNIAGREDILQIKGLLSLQKNEGKSVQQISFVGQCEEINLAVEENTFGKVDVVFENEHCGLYRLRLAPFTKIPVHMHKKMLESELVASDGLNLQGKHVKSGTSIKWPLGFPHRYLNLGEHEQLIICIDKPAFNPEDEILLAHDTSCPDLEENMVKHYW